MATVTDQPVSPTPTDNGLFFDYGYAGMLAVGGFIIILVIGIIGSLASSKKRVLGTAKWASRADKQAARRRSHKQVKNPDHSVNTLWINSPKSIDGAKINSDSKTIWLPDASRGMSVIGGSGSGKSYSVIKPTLRSAIAQGMPTILLDTDYPGLAKTIAPLAESAGYDVRIFAPGYPESRVCNVLDFISAANDATGASQISKTLHKNFSEGGSGNEDRFFQVSGELATEASMLLAKRLKYPDILTAFAILKDQDMIARVKNVGRIDPWLELSFGQLLSTAKSEKTVDSIRGTAAILFGQLMRPDILPALIGESTIPTTVNGKTLLIFGVKQDIRLVVSPLIAAIIHAIVTQTVLPGRKEPLFLSLDELPSMFFPEIAEWLSEKRKYGLCAQIGYQSLEQLKKRYGAELADVIFTNTATKFLFNPQSINSAEIFSKTLGETDVVYKTTGRSYGKGRSRSRTEHRAKKPLFTPDEFMGLDEGSCVLISPGYGARRKKFVPVLYDPIKIEENELRIQEMTQDHWNEFITRATREGVGNRTISPNEITKRVEDFQSLCPVPDKRASTNSTSFEDLLKV